MNVAFIPARGGSKSIPLKNIKPICGKPLIYWTTRAACEHDKVVIIGRSAESASDTASTESAMLEFAEKYEFDNIVLIQATSPLLQSIDLNHGFETYNTKGTDSVLSVVLQKRFTWKREKKGNVQPMNYDVFHRPRRQEFDGYYVENGAFYITSRKNLLMSQNRISGNIKAVVMNQDSFFEVDEPSDWTIIEMLMEKNGIIEKVDIPEIRLFLSDCDGCLTDGGMYYSEYGDELKKFNTKDGMGFQLLREKGILTGIITSENVELNRRRANKMKLDIFESGCKDKVQIVRQICEESGINLSNVCYIGDDLNDIELIKLVGYGCTPADSIPMVKKAAKYVTRARGGEGVIREVAEQIIHQMNK